MPGFIDPYKMAKNKQTLNGKLAVASMLRANKMLESEEGEVGYSLKFDIDEDKSCYISGEIQTTVLMRCQRCLQNFLIEVSGSFMVSPVKDDFAAKSLSRDYEPVIVEEDKLFPAELVEDELILAMPLAPMHNDYCVDNNQGQVDEVQDLKNPFQILQELNVNKKGQKAGDK